MDYAYAHKIIVDNVRTVSEPIGLKLIPNGQLLPENAILPSDTGIKVAMCQWTNLARRQGVVVGLRADDIDCAPCQVGFGFKKLQNPNALVKFLQKMGYIDDPEVAQSVLSQEMILPAGSYESILAFPLNLAPLDPDVIWIYGNPAQMNHLVIALLRKRGQIIPSHTGLGLACRKGFSDEPMIIIPGRGERNIGCTSESELFLTLPAALLEDLVTGLEAACRNHIKAPVIGPLPHHMPYIQAMQELTEFLVDP